MIGKHILLITFSNEHELIFFWGTVKWFQVFLSSMNNSIYYKSFVCTKLVILFYAISSFFRSFNTELNFKQFSRFCLKTVLFQAIQFSLKTQFSSI